MGFEKSRFIGWRSNIFASVSPESCHLSGQECMVPDLRLHCAAVAGLFESGTAYQGCAAFNCCSRRSRIYAIAIYILFVQNGSIGE